MKLKPIAVGLAVALCAGTGGFFLVRAHRSASAAGAADEEEKVPPVISVQVGPLKRGTLHHYIEGYGIIETAPATADQPAAGAALAPATAGIVARSKMVPGQEVKKGELLMELNSGTVSLEYAQEELARQRKLYEQHNTSLKSLQTAEAQLAALRVVAPLSGTITRVNVRPGQAVDVNTVVAELADLNRLAVSASIPASSMKELKVGDPIQLLTQPPVTTEVYFIGPGVDPSNDTVPVLGLLPPQSGLRPGQFVQLRLVVAIHTNCLIAPEASVVTDLDGQSVLSRVSGDQATRTPVQTGFRENGWVEVAGPGLKEGDAVVTVGAYGLPDKTHISIVSAAPPETAATNSTPAAAQ